MGLSSDRPPGTSSAATAVLTGTAQAESSSWSGGRVREEEQPGSIEPSCGGGCAGRVQSHPSISIAVCDPASAKLAFSPGVWGGSGL
jgi:hypothetical protein